MENIGTIIIILILVWNLITFIIMGIDKSKAKRGKQRISEATLITSAFIMGAAGSIAGALVFHHKTKKIKFRILLPIALIVNIAIIILQAYLTEIL